MRTSKIISIALLIFVSVAGWKIGELLNPQSVGMALGVIFGMMAGIPAALIALAASRVRVEHVHHHRVEETPQEHTMKPTVAIPAKPTSYVVVPTTSKSAQLQTVRPNQIEVRR